MMTEDFLWKQLKESLEQRAFLEEKHNKLKKEYEELCIKWNNLNDEVNKKFKYDVTSEYLAYKNTVVLNSRITYDESLFELSKIDMAEQIARQVYAEIKEHLRLKTNNKKESYESTK